MVSAGVYHVGRSLLAARVWNLMTDAGPLDLALEPADSGGYPDLVRDAESMTIGGAPVLVASLADVVRSKEAAGRDKDQVTLPTLRRMLADEADP